MKYSAKAATVTAMVFLSHVAAFGQPDGMWPMFQHDASRTGRSEYAGSTKGWLHWSFDIGSCLIDQILDNTSPVIGNDGTVYVGSLNNNFYSLDSSGAFRWSYFAGYWINTTPAIGAGGRIYFGSDDNKLYSLDLIGALSWSYAMAWVIRSSPAVDSAGNIYTASEEPGMIPRSRIYSITPAGSLRWSYRLWDYTLSSPSIRADGKVAIGSGWWIAGDTVTVLDSTGALQWSYDAGFYVVSSPAWHSDGGLSFASWDRNIYSLTSSGALKWSYATDWQLESSTAIGFDDEIYVGSWDAYGGRDMLYALGSAGALTWSYEAAGGIFSSPAIDSDGRIYFGSIDQNIYCLNSSGSRLWSYQTDYAIESSMAIDSDRRTYAVSGDGNIYCLADFTPLPTATSTPTATPLPPDITNIVWDDGSTPKGDVVITWDSQTGVTYDVYYASSFAGTYTDIADVTATGSITTWTDDGSQTGSHPSTADERYYKVACYGTSDYAEYVVGMYKLVMGYQASTDAYSAASPPLIPYYTGDAPDVNDIIGDQGHSSSVRAYADKIWKFDPGTQSFGQYCWNNNGTWEGYPGGTDTTLDPDTGFAFLYQNSEDDKNQNIYVVGKAAKGNECQNEITGKGEASSKNSYVGYNYLDEESLDDSHILEDGFTGNAMRSFSDKVWPFDFATQSFYGYAWYDTEDWQYYGISAFDLTPGEAYLIYNKNEVDDWTWTVTNPVGY